MNQNDSLRNLCKIGGISLIVIAIAYIVIFVSFAIEQPESGADQIVMAEAFLSDLKPLFLIMTVCSSLAGILYLPAVSALYFALQKFNKGIIVLASVLIITMVALILMQNTFNIAIMSISENFAAVDTEVLKTGYLTASTLVLSASFKAEFFIVILLSISTILISSVMLNGSFGKFVGYFGIAAGIVNFISQIITIPLGSHHEAALIAAFFGLILNIIWFINVGYKLIKIQEENI